MRRWVVVAVLVVLTTSCGARSEPGTPTAAVDPRYSGTGAVIDWPSVGPRLCFSVMESDPPQCGGGVELAGWNWSEVDGEGSRDGVRYLDHVTLVGTFDDDTLTVTEPPRDPEPTVDTYEPPGTPCAEPAGGWQVLDPTTSMNGYTGMDAVQRYASAQPDFAELWLDDATLNVAFTSDLDRHEHAIRSVWGGMLCVSQLEHTRAELEAIGAQLGMGSDPNVFAWMADPIKGRVTVSAIVDDGFQADLDQRFGAGITHVEAMLKPVE